MRINDYLVHSQNFSSYNGIDKKFQKFGAEPWKSSQVNVSSTRAPALRARMNPLGGGEVESIDWGGGIDRE